MKGVKKCYGLLLALLIIFGLSLSVSLDTSALKYDIVQYPIADVNFVVNPTYPTQISRVSSNGFRLSFDSSSYLPSFNDDLFFYAVSNDSGGCKYQNYGHIYKTQNGTTVYVNFPAFSDLITYSSDFSGARECMTFSPISGMDWNTLPLASPQVGSFLSKNNPYYFPYSGAYASDCDTENGLQACTRFSLSNLFTSVPTGAFGHLTNLMIPLGAPGEDVGQFVNGSHLDFNFEIDFDSDTDPTSSFGDHFTSYIRARTGGTSIGTSSLCTYDIQDYRSDTERYPYTLSLNCGWDSTYDVPVGSVSFWLEFSPNSSSTLWDYSADTMVFYSSVVVSDYDDTPADVSFTSGVVGGQLDRAPGSAKNPSSDTSDDFFSSLANMFSFGFFNPFAPIFALFTDNDSCVNIPILAGMLNSEDTTYCPWFDSSVRNVLTPVLGIASVMLIFGFAVRWLGASSGNLFEDSSHETLAPPGWSGHWGRRKK